jgi:hypothetical protein
MVISVQLSLSPAVSFLLLRRLRSRSSIFEDWSFVLGPLAYEKLSIHSGLDVPEVWIQKELQIRCG